MRPCGFCRGTARIAPFIVFAAMGASPAHAQPAFTNAQATSAAASSSGAHEQYCEEEVRLAEQWMLWAVGRRDECARASPESSDQSSCLSEHVRQLDVIEKEYAEVYTSQMRNLRQDHPVVMTIMRRLKSHKALAGAILQQRDAEPETLAASLKRSCLDDYRQPPARVRR